MNYVIFTTYDEKRDGQTRIGICQCSEIEVGLILWTDRNLKNRFSQETQEQYAAQYAATWKNLDSVATIFRERTIEEALDQARQIGGQSNDIQVLITGSLHLVSGALCLLEPDQSMSYLCWYREYYFYKPVKLCPRLSVFSVAPAFLIETRSNFKKKLYITRCVANQADEA